MKSLLTIMFVLAMAFTAGAQDTQKKSSAATPVSNERAVMQDGNSATKNEKAVMQDGNSVKQNEKAVMQDGNSATPKERKAVMQDGNAKTVEHKCNDKCKSGKHELLHGEKGHQCTTTCKHHTSGK